MAAGNDSPLVGADYLIRRPQLADADELAELHVAVWRQAYAGMMSAKALADLDVGQFAAMWRRIAESVTDRERERNTIRIAQHLSTGALAGFATVGAARDDDAPVPANYGPSTSWPRIMARASLIGSWLRRSAMSPPTCGWSKGTPARSPFTVGTGSFPTAAGSTTTTWAPTRFEWSGPELRAASEILRARGAGTD